MPFLGTTTQYETAPKGAVFIGNSYKIPRYGYTTYTLPRAHFLRKMSP